MGTFKVGDKVIRTQRNGVRGIKLGQECTVSGVSTDGRWLGVKEMTPGCDPLPFEYCNFKAAPHGVVQGQAGGLKFDGGKTQWSLLLSGKGMLNALRGVVGILMFGAKKYKAYSWREVEDNERRYLDALFRHYSEIMEHGLDSRDEESGKLHIDHLNCNGLFLGELARKAK